ncbi:MAG: hypothetical protein HC903_25685 [Methylacidiphilales bacterium]|nr:hypothetical protein [Candidatus Methylacidiphilales bacterium]NJR14746.1 hypothetical protein [Calothrix sp. CSU_2_0]
MNGNKQLLEQPENANNLVEQPNTDSVSEYEENPIAKIAIASLVGATIGAIAGVLALKNSSQRINQSIKNVGNTVKNVVENVNQTLKDTSDTIKSAASSIDETVKEVGKTVKNSAVDTNDTVKDAVDSVKDTAVNVNDTVKNTMHIVKGAATGVQETVKDTVDIAKKVVADDEKSSNSENIQVSDNQTTYILVPVEHQE